MTDVLPAAPHPVSNGKRRKPASTATSSSSLGDVAGAKAAADVKARKAAAAEALASLPVVEESAPVKKKRVAKAVTGSPKKSKKVTKAANAKSPSTKASKSKTTPVTDGSAVTKKKKKPNYFKKTRMAARKEVMKGGWTDTGSFFLPSRIARIVRKLTQDVVDDDKKLKHIDRSVKQTDGTRVMVSKKYKVKFTSGALITIQAWLERDRMSKFLRQATGLLNYAGKTQFDRRAFEQAEALVDNGNLELDWITTDIERRQRAGEKKAAAAARKAAGGEEDPMEGVEAAASSSSS